MSRAILEAQDAGLDGEVSVGFYLLSLLQYRTGDLGGAHASTLQAVEAARAADPGTAARRLADTARCLCLLEREIPYAEALAAEAEALAKPVELDLFDIPFAQGIVCRFRGDYERAGELLGRALALVRRAQDHWPEWNCLAQLALIDLERGRPAEALARCAPLVELAGKLGEGSEGPFSAAIEALARLELGERGAEDRVEGALAVGW